MASQKKIHRDRRRTLAKALRLKKPARTDNKYDPIAGGFAHFFGVSFEEAEAICGLGPWTLKSPAPEGTNAEMAVMLARALEDFND